MRVLPLSMPLTLPSTPAARPSPPPGHNPAEEAPAPPFCLSRMPSLLLVKYAPVLAAAGGKGGHTRPVYRQVWRGCPAGGPHNHGLQSGAPGSAASPTGKGLRARALQRAGRRCDRDGWMRRSGLAALQPQDGPTQRSSRRAGTCKRGGAACQQGQKRNSDCAFHCPTPARCPRPRPRVQDDPTEQIFVFFPDEVKVGVKTIKLLAERMRNEGVQRAIMVTQVRLVGVDECVSECVRGGGVCVWGGGLEQARQEAALCPSAPGVHAAAHASMDGRGKGPGLRRCALSHRPCVAGPAVAQGRWRRIRVADSCAEALACALTGASTQSAATI